MNNEADDTTAVGKGVNGYVKALSHGLQILDMFSADVQTVSVGEMAKALSVHRSSASRLAATLAAHAYLEPTAATGRYRLGTKIATLQRFSSDPTDYERVILPLLRELVNQTGETAHIARLSAGDAVSTVVIDGWHTVRMHSWAGKRNPAYVSSMGKCLLAGMPDDEVRALYAGAPMRSFTANTITSADRLIEDLEGIRARRYSVDHEELENGLRCIGAPIFDAAGKVVTSISISGPAARVTPEAVPLLAQHVMHCAQQASAALGAPARPDGWPGPVTEPLPGLPWVEEARAKL